MDVNLTETEYLMPMGDMKERRLRDLLKAVEVPLYTVLRAFVGEDAPELLQLAADHASNTSSSFQGLRQFQALRGLPIVLDAVQAYNECDTTAERVQALSFLAHQFKRK